MERPPASPVSRETYASWFPAEQVLALGLHRLLRTRRGMHLIQLGIGLIALIRTVHASILVHRDAPVGVRRPSRARKACERHQDHESQQPKCRSARPRIWRTLLPMQRAPLCFHAPAALRRACLFDVSIAAYVAARTKFVAEGRIKLCRRIIVPRSGCHGGTDDLGSVFGLCVASHRQQRSSTRRGIAPWKRGSKCDHTSPPFMYKKFLQYDRGRTWDI